MNQIQFMSDLHLESPEGYDIFEITPAAPYLALIGDIGNVKHKGLLEFITTQLTQFKIVFFLLGNHEPYHSNWANTKERFLEFEKETREKSTTAEGLGSFIFMDQTRFDLSDEITILGCTLYSGIAPEHSDDVSTGLNDFYLIGGWSVEEHCQEHAKDVKWLNDRVKTISETEGHREIVVLTHHSPTTSPNSFDPAHASSRISSGFMTDLSKEACWTSRNVKVWAFGHTHYNCDYVEDGKRVVTNQRGYYFKQAEGFDGRKIIEI